MKSKLLSLTIIIVILILLASTLRNVNSIKESHGIEAISSRITSTRVLIQKARERQSTLESQLASATLLAKEAVLPADLNSGAVFDTVLKLAQESQVKVGSARAQTATKEKNGKYAYTVLPFTVEATGDTSHLLTFLNKLETQAFSTLVLNSVTLTAGKTSFTATANFSIYIFPSTSVLETTTQ